jgi:rhomboid protease GluP
MGFQWLVMWACGGLFLATLVSSPEGFQVGGGLFSLLAPDSTSLLVYGASGSVPVFQLGRVWTVLSASWLHGGVLHILFNMMALRTLIPTVAHFYGPARTVILYVCAGVVAFTASSCAAQYLTFMPRFLSGGHLTIGASGSLYGMIGAVAWYGRRSGSRLVAAHAREWALSGVVMGLLVPGIDNWAHLGGFVGGWLMARWLDPLRSERGDHVLAAIVLLLLSAGSILLSIVTGLPLVRGE